MSSSTRPAADTSTPATGRKTVALIGNPNTGKSTLFNALSGLKARVGNYPGVTVEKKVGRVVWDGREIDLIDLPGTYSLSPRSPDEMVSVDVLLGRQAGVNPVDAVICIADASNLERNLYLVSQVLDLGLPTVVVLNMSDVAAANGIEIDEQKLSERLGVPVVGTEAHRRKRLGDVKLAIAEAVDRPRRIPEPLFPDVFYKTVGELRETIRAEKQIDLPEFLAQRLLIDRGGELEQELADKSPAGRRLLDALENLRSGLADENCRVPAIEARVRYGWARTVLTDTVRMPRERPVSRSDRIDRILTHRVWGLAIFAAMMFLVFQSIYAWAEPLMEGIEAGQEAVAGWVTAGVQPGPLRSLLVDGVIAGVGGVLVFLPQICLLFLFLSILEDCGYMSRAAFLMDKLMSRLGLSGKSFVPLMSSFACAIPGVMATRVIENRKDRMVTLLVAPLMSCSARLPVYLLLIAAFIPSRVLWSAFSFQVGGRSYYAGLGLHGLVLFAMYALGILVAIPVAWILKKTFFKGETPPFVMELPGYKIPSFRVVGQRVYDRAWSFVARAGTLIFATSIVVWALGYFPGDHSEEHRLTAEIEELESRDTLTAAEEEQLEELGETRNQVSAELIEASLLGRMGHAIEPAVKPLGWDWKIGMGAIASFPAREVIIATLGTIYSLGGDVDEESEGLQGTLREAKWPDGSKVFNVPVALSIMVFFALCAQCAATLMVIKRETNSWRWPVFTFVYMTVLAYVGALATYQIGRLWL